MKLLHLFKKQSNIGESKDRYWIKHNDILAQPEEKRQGCMKAYFREGAYLNGWTKIAEDIFRFPKPEHVMAWEYGGFDKGFH